MHGRHQRTSNKIQLELCEVLALTDKEKLDALLQFVAELLCAVPREDDGGEAPWLVEWREKFNRLYEQRLDR